MLAKQWLENSRAVMNRIEHSQLENIRKAAEVMADPAPALQNLGVLLYTGGRRDEAVRLFERAIAAVERGGQPVKSGAPYMAMAVAMEDAGKRAEALEYLAKARACLGAACRVPLPPDLR